MTKRKQSIPKSEVEELKLLLDQKNRELEIEAALEKVRKRAFRMMQSKELGSVIWLIHQKLLDLGVEHNSALLVTDFDNKKMSLHVWLAAEDRKYLQKFYFPFIDHPITHAFFGSNGFYTETFSKKEKNDYFRKVFENTEMKRLSEDRKNALFNAPGWARSVIKLENSALVIQNYTDNAFKKKENEIIRKFADVFEQTYTRFLDLQKAETQAREAQIEAALERIRAHMMAMQKSEDLLKVIDVLYMEIRNLGFSETTSDLELTIVNENENTMTVWSSNDNFSGPESRNSEIDLDKFPVLDRQYHKWRGLSPDARKKLSLEFKSEGKEWLEMLESLKSHPDWSPAVKVFFENNIIEWHWLHAYIGMVP